MKRYLLLLTAYLLLFCSKVVSQDDPVLMQINGKEILRSEFEYVYNKAFPSEKANKKKINGFTDIFIINKLKIEEAKKMGLDTIPEMNSPFAKDQTRRMRKRFNEFRINNIPINELYNSTSSKGEEEQILVTQIFKHLPQNSTTNKQKETLALVNSFYETLSKNPQLDFSEFVNTHSDDKKVFWISKRQMPKEFENTVFTLSKGEISQPFQSPLGIHIIKVLDKQNIRPSESVLVSKQQRHRRGRTINNSILDQLKNTHKYLPYDKGIEELLEKGKTDKLLFSLNGKDYTGKDFDRFSENGIRDIRKEFDHFVAKSIFDHSVTTMPKNKNLNNDILYQVYRDSLLLNKINDLKITQKSQEKAGLTAYFTTHKKDYSWDEARFRGIVLHSTDKKTAKQAKKLTKKRPLEEWSDIITKHFNTHSTQKVKVESGLFAQGSNPYVDKLAFKKGNFLPMKGYPYTSIIGKKSKKPETYSEVGKRLQSDYRNFLESIWITELRRNSKVEINQEVLKTVNNH